MEKKQAAKWAGCWGESGGLKFESWGRKRVSESSCSQKAVVSRTLRRCFLCIRTTLAPWKEQRDENAEMFLIISWLLDCFSNCDAALRQGQGKVDDFSCV